MAPFVAALIKGGLPILANAVAKQGKEWVEDKMGIDLPSLETAELTAEQLAQLRAAEAEHRNALVEAVKEISVTEIQDAASARAMQAAASKADGWLAQNFIYVLTGFWSVVSCTYLAAITFIEVPKENQRIVDTILGFLLGTAISSIFGYFYGTTRSSNAKDGVVSRLLDRLSQKELQ